METESLIDSANKAALRLEEANKVNAELVRRMEAIEARRVLGGYSEVGQKAPELSDEEKIKIDTRNMFKGTVIEKAFQ
jgi:hypothetical protein